MRDPYLVESIALTEAGNQRAMTDYGARSIDMPTLTIVYVIEDDDLIVITAARFEDAKASQAGHA